MKQQVVGWLVGVLLVTAALGSGPLAPDAGLRPEDRRLIAQLDVRVGAQVEAGRFEEAAEGMRQVADIRQRRQGKGHWQAVDARFEAQRWALLTKVPRKDRPRLVALLVRLAQDRK